MSGTGAVFRQFLGLAVSSACFFSANYASSQITPDRTLPNNSSVTINRSTFNITGGTQAGRNLFHSFQQFSLPANNTALFNNGLDIQNIFSRVTGGSVSTINGTIQANGTANVFFLNPAGIVFGKNASLNVGGSFVATTANAIQFGNLGSFSASEPNNPALLTVNPTALFYNQIVRSASIQNSSQASVNGNVTGLQVPDGRSLLLVGGNVNIDGGKLSAYGGQVFLGGLAAPGTVGLGVDGNIINLNIPDDLARGDVLLNNGAMVDVRAVNGGSIGIKGHNVDILGGSQLNAGIPLGMGTQNSQAGDITINATGTFTMNQASSINNTVPANDSNTVFAMGSAGNINIQAGGDISIVNLASTPALDAGNNTNAHGDNFPRSQVGHAGNISLRANGNISVIGQDVSSDDKVISTFGNSPGGGDISLQANGAISLNDAYFVASNAGGDAGNISLQANQSISLANNSSLKSTALFSGNSGKITLQSLSGSVSFQNSFVSTELGYQDYPSFNPALGNAGNITISGKSVSVTDGAAISSTSFSGLNSGTIQITGTEQVEISGKVPVTSNPDTSRNYLYKYTTLATTSEQQSRGVAGDINITTKDLRVSNGANLRAETRSNGRGGDININANTFELTGGGQLITTAFSTGDAGNVNLNVKDRVVISGINPDKYTLYNQIADVTTQMESEQTKEDGSPMFTPEQVQADSIRYATQYVGIVDPLNNPTARSEIFAPTARSGIFANTLGSSTAKGGNVNITTGSLQVQNGGSVTVSSPQEQAGNLTITAQDIRLNQGYLTAETAITRPNDPGANITLQGLNFLLLQNGSFISARASGNATGGNVTINANNGFVVAPLLQGIDIIASASEGRGGDVRITSRQIFGLTQGKNVPGNSANVVDVSSEFSNPGTVTLNTLDIDRSLGLETLPTLVVDASRLVDTSCTTSSRTKFNELIITGRGGLSPSPYEPLTSDAIWSDTRLPLTTAHQNQPNKNVAKIKPKPIEIVPATGWVFNGKGEVTLISSVSNSTSSTPTSCPAR